VEKFSYGYSRYTFPFGAWPSANMKAASWQRAAARRCGGVQIPQDNSTDFIKRVIGLPGDRSR
jgi:signal peptidase I